MIEYDAMMNNAIENVVKLPFEKVIEQELKLLTVKHRFDIEASSVCNLNCSFCPRHTMRPYGIMAKETMKKLSQWIPMGSDAIISGLGEPLINPSLPTLVKELKSNGIGVSIITNGQLLSEEILKGLIDAGVDELQISLHTLDPNKYERITSKPWLNVVLKNLKMLQSIQNNRINIRINCVLTDDNPDSLTDISEYTKNNGFELFIRRVHTRGGSIPTERTIIESDSIRCGTFAQVTFITWNGDILACSNDVNGITKYGNIYTHNFSEIIDIKMKVIQNHRLPEICKKCNDDYRYYILNSNGLPNK